MGPPRLHVSGLPHVVANRCCLPLLLCLVLLIVVLGHKVWPAASGLSVRLLLRRRLRAGVLPAWLRRRRPCRHGRRWRCWECASLPAAGLAAKGLSSVSLCGERRLPIGCCIRTKGLLLLRWRLLLLWVGAVLLMRLLPKCKLGSWGSRRLQA